MKIPVVVSITSLPSRIHKIRPTLESLLEGSVVPDTIFLTLPQRSFRENTGYDLPDFLSDATFCQGIVKIARAAEDYGPGTKLLGSLPYLHQPSIIVLAYDDVRYRRDFLERLVSSQAADHKSAFSFYSYRTHGLTVGQGCDGFSNWSPNLAGIEEFFEHHVLGYGHNVP